MAAKQAANILKILSYLIILPAVPQDQTKSAYFEMPTAAKLTINRAEMSAKKIIRLVNACIPWNKGAGTMINNWSIVLTEAEIAGTVHSPEIAPGCIIECNDGLGLILKTVDNKKLRINIIYTNEGFFRLKGYRFLALNRHTIRIIIK